MADPSHPSSYAASQTALLLLDFHALFVNSLGASAQSAAAAAAGTRKWAHEKGIHVIHCLIDTSLEPFPTCKGAERLSAIRTAMQGEGGKEHADLMVGGNDVTFTRRAGHVSALLSPGLNDHLKSKGIVSLFLAGLSTSGCVTRTAIAAADAEYVVTVLEDGCADGDEELHRVLMDKVLNHRGYVAAADEVKAYFA